MPSDRKSKKRHLKSARKESSVKDNGFESGELQKNPNELRDVIVDPFAPVDGQFAALLGPSPEEIRDMLQNVPDISDENSCEDMSQGDASNKSTEFGKKYTCMIDDCGKIFPDHGSYRKH